MKFVQTLSDEVQQELHKIYQHHTCFKNRQRAHAILLSLRGYTINQIQDILQADRDSISVWIDRFNAQGIAGLDDLPRSGRPSIYTAEEIAFFKAEVDKEPRQIKQAQAKLQQQTAKTSSKCQVPCDHIPKRSYPLFKAREALAELINQLQKTAA